METLVFCKDEKSSLDDLISAEGEVVKFSQDQIERSGRDYLIACSQNDKDERVHRAEVMKEASRIFIF